MIHIYCVQFGVSTSDKPQSVAKLLSTKTLQKPTVVFACQLAKTPQMKDHLVWKHHLPWHFGINFTCISTCMDRPPAL